jgi:hypothetical protein
MTQPHRSLNPLAALLLAALLTGCAGTAPGNFGIGTTPANGSAIHVDGLVRGGQNPVSGATIQLYTVGTTGIGTASTGLISATVTTSDGTGIVDSNANAGNANNTPPLGSFTITGDYSCTGATPGTQVYLVASGGNPGSGTNSNLSLVAALGSCSTLLANAATTFIQMDEITTVAAAYALAPFTTNLTHIGATGSNPTGLVNAFANAQSLANYSTGTAGGASLPSGTVAPVTEINTLADIIAACVNTTGSASPNCTTLFGATSASDTFGAALAIAKSPGASAVTSLYTLANPSAPFQPTMSTQPNDFTLALNYTAGGTMSTPWAIAIDASGNAWVTNEAGSTVTELSPTGNLLASPTASGLFGAQGIAIDRSGNVWVANTAGNSVIEFTLTAGSVTGTNSYTTGGINAPSAIAINSAGYAFIANFNGNSVTGLNTSGNALSGSPFTGNSNDITVPSAIAIDTAGNVYVTSGQGSAIKLTSTGAYSATLTDNALQSPAAIALNASNDVEMPGFLTGSSVTSGDSEFSPTGVATSRSPINAGIYIPGTSITSDGTNFWLTNANTSGSLLEINYQSSNSVPAAGYGALNAPIGVAVDPSGCIWTANSGNNTVTQFFGLTIPATTPIAANVGP